MNSPLAVTALVGRVLVLFSLLMAVPLAFALSVHDPAEKAFLISIGVTFAAGVGLTLATRRFRRELQLRDGFVLVTLIWLVLPAFAALPLTVIAFVLMAASRVPALPVVAVIVSVFVSM